MKIPSIYISDKDIIGENNKIFEIFKKYSTIKQTEIAGKIKNRFIVNAKDILSFLETLDKEIYDEVTSELKGALSKEPMKCLNFMTKWYN